MPAAPNKPSRGRPRSINPDRIYEAVLSIKGREPTIDELIDILGVSKATFYNYIPGYEALKEFFGDAICRELELPEVTSGMHWIDWSMELANLIRQLLSDYPIVIEQLTPRPGQLQLLENVLAKLHQMGLDYNTSLYVFVAVVNVVVGEAHAKAHGHISTTDHNVGEEFEQAIEQAQTTAPHLSALYEQGFQLDSLSVFEDILRFTLEGIARTRGLSLPPP